MNEKLLEYFAYFFIGVGFVVQLVNSTKDKDSERYRDYQEPDNRDLDDNDDTIYIIRNLVDEMRYYREKVDAIEARLSEQDTDNDS